MCLAWQFLAFPGLPSLVLSEAWCSLPTSTWRVQHPPRPPPPPAYVSSVLLNPEFWSLLGHTHPEWEGFAPLCW